MKNSPSSLPNNSFKDSTMTTTNSLSYANVLRLLADQIDERNRIEEENKRLKEKNDEDARVLQWVNDFEKSSGDFSIRGTALLFNLRPRFLYQYLRDKGILIEQNQANAAYRKQGFLIERRYSFKQKNGNTKTFYSTRITPAGLVQIWTLLWKDGMVLDT